MFGIGAGLMPFIIIGLIILWNAINILPEYERGVVFRLGRIVAARGPGLIIVIPGLEKMVRVDLRTITLDVPVQEVITKDNVPCKVNAVCYFEVLDPVRAVIKVMNYMMATSQIAQTTLRSVLGQVDFDELLSHREKINSQLQHIIDQQTDPWGIKVSIVEVKDVQVPEQMQRAMAHQAEAERNRRAKVIIAEGEFQAAQKISEAARIIASEPSALTLRFLQTAQEIGASERTSTLILPIPMEMIRFLQYAAEKPKS
jgi:regulator of protease activity HflC (stomatin/prohibitin superfamily)